MPAATVAAMAGASVFFIIAALAWPRRRSAVRERLERYAEQRPVTLQELEWQEPFADRVLKPILQKLAGGVLRLTPQHYVRTLRHRLQLAGNPYGWGVSEFLGLRGLAALLALLVSFLLVLTTSKSPFQSLIMLATAVLLGFQLPIIWLGGRIRRRRKEIQRALPDALDLLTISVEAGLGFDGALAKVATRWDNELSKGFDRALGEIRLGKNRAGALKDMSSRMEVDDVRGFVAAVVQADELGVPIAKILRVQSGQMRVKRRQRAEESAQMAPIKMLFPMVFLIFPALFVVLLGPAVPQIMEAFAGMR